LVHVARRILTIEDLGLEGKTVFVRVDINTPVDPVSGRLLDLSRIVEASTTIRDLAGICRVVVGSHQGRVGRYDYISLEGHARELSRALGRDVKFVPDVMGPAALDEIRRLDVGDILLLDNLRFVAEENMEFGFEEAKNTVFVRRLRPVLEAVVLDAFPTAHRAHPSIVGLSEVLPTCGGRLVVKEMRAMERILTVAKGPYTAVLGGAKVSDRLEAIETLIANGRGDKVLLTGVIANVFLKAKGVLKGRLNLDKEEAYVAKAAKLLEAYPDVFELPLDLGVERGGERFDVEAGELREGDRVLDIGPRTVDHYSRLIRSAGTVFMSGPPGAFEIDGFGMGTERLLRAMASSYATTIVSGGHLAAALERFKIREWIDHISTAGGALVLYLAGKSLPMIEALTRAAERWSRSP